MHFIMADENNLVRGKFTPRNWSEELLNNLMYGIEMGKYEDPLWILDALTSHYHYLMKMDVLDKQKAR